MDLDLGVTSSVLDALSMRSKVALHNIANQNTPGYKKQYVEFESMLREAHARGDDADKVAPVIARDTSGRPGVNNVSVMEELSILQKVSMLHDIFSKRAAGYFSNLKHAIRGQ